MDMREHIKEKTELAQIYADDGAYGSAARVLRELADKVQEHAERNAFNLKVFADAKAFFAAPIKPE